MLISTLKVLRSHGSQYIEHLDEVVLPETFRGHPLISRDVEHSTAVEVASICPTGAIAAEPLSIDLGRCMFCGECARRYPEALRFGNNHRIASNNRNNLIIDANTPEDSIFDPESYNEEIVRLFGRALKLRQVSAGGDGSAEMELNASVNVNFDFQRYGLDFVASPRHADGIVITGPITASMSNALEICYNAIAEPKIIIVAGTDAISGGLFADSPAIDRSFFDYHKVDLYVPGNPPHPLTFIDGVINMLRRQYY